MRRFPGDVVCSGWLGFRWSFLNHHFRFLHWLLNLLRRFNFSFSFSVALFLDVDRDFDLDFNLSVYILLS
ncbi:hypothetical protein L0F63_007516, partial [Massospora cicadina]